MLGQNVSRREYAAILRRGLADNEPLLAISPEDTSRCYNRRPYLISHTLQDCDLFSLQSICSLARRVPAQKVSIRRGKIASDTEIESSFKSDRDISIDDVADGLESRGLYLYVENPERDPVYRDVMLRILANIAAGVRAVDGPITWYSAYFFVSSAESVTPYHMDREMNYLLQIAGTKNVRLWDQASSEVMTEVEKDRLLSYVGERPGIRPEVDRISSSHTLTPGVGIHQPFIAPHLVRTASSLSISLAFTYRTTHSDRLTHAHHFNHLVRKMGLHPRNAGSQGLWNQMKAMAYRGYSAVRGHGAH